MANRTNDFSRPMSIADGGTSATTANGARTALGITIGARNIVGTTDQIGVVDGDGALGNPIISMASNPVVPGVGAITPPIGATIDQPVTPATGMLRGNNDTDYAEIYSNGLWQKINNREAVLSLSVTVSYGALVTGGQVNLITPEDATASYRLSNIQLNGFGTNFDGAGDRDLLITDGAAEWTLIPAATLKSLANSQWGDTSVPYPAAVPLNESCIPGSPIYATYANGTTDYVDGSLVLTLNYVRVA